MANTLKSIAAIALGLGLIAYGFAFLWLGAAPDIAPDLQLTFAWSGAGLILCGGTMPLLIISGLYR